MMESVTEQEKTDGVASAAAELAASEASRLTPGFFKEFFENHSEAMALGACLRVIAAGEPAAVVRSVAEWLIRGSAYVSVLLDPKLLSPEEAKKAAAVCRAIDPRFLGKVQQFLTDPDAPVQVVTGGLSLLGDNEPGTLVPLLRTLSHSGDQHIRSLAAKALCKLRPNRMLIERQLQSHDPRTRANAVEALWGLKTAESAEVFRMASADVHHRVAVNALIGLHALGDESAFGRLTALTQHPSALFRMAAAWALGYLKDPRGAAALEALERDPLLCVKRRAAAALAELHAAQAENTSSGSEAAKS
jgi:HEAT repeat protein